MRNLETIFKASVKLKINGKPPDITCLCVSGLSPDLQSMEQIRRIMRPTDVPDTGRY